MCNSKSINKIMSLCLSILLVLTMLVGLPISASAADVTLGLSSPDNAWWEVNTEGNTDLTGRGKWTPVNDATRYHWELYWIDSFDFSISRDPDIDDLVTEGFTADTTIDLAAHIYAYDKYGIYYFMVCAMGEGDEINLSGIREFSVSDYLLYDESTDPNKNPDVNIGSRSSGGSNTPDSHRTTTATLPAGWSGITETANPATQNSTTLKAIADAAKSSGKMVATSKGFGEVTVQASAWSQLSGLKFQHDTVVDGAVQVRVTINSPATITSDLKVSGYTTGQEVNRVRNIFKTYFSNTTNIVYLDQAGFWGQEVRIAAKFDLSTINADNLVFYSYDETANSYYRIQNPNYTVDANGYIHFSTQYAGSIVISDGPLVKK